MTECSLCGVRVPEEAALLQLRHATRAHPNRVVTFRRVAA